LIPAIAGIRPKKDAGKNEIKYGERPKQCGRKETHFLFSLGSYGVNSIT